MRQHHCSRRPAVAGMGDWRQRYPLACRGESGPRLSRNPTLCLGVMERSSACASEA
jgi:hypothetical protein